MKQKSPPALQNRSARDIAVNCLLDFEKCQMLIQDSLDIAFKSTSLKDADKRLAAELAWGSCRRLITLDFLLTRHSNRPIAKIDPLVRQILRVGLYQLLFLERTPDFAVLSESVQQCKSARLLSAGGFVNAILRSVQSHIKGPVKFSPDEMTKRFSRSIIRTTNDAAIQFKTEILPHPCKKSAKYFSVAFGYPRWLMERWLKYFSMDQLAEICSAGNTRPSLNLRANRLRCTVEQLQNRLNEAGLTSEKIPHGVQLNAPAAPDHLPGFQQGWFSIQDSTAMTVAPTLAPQPGQRILDLCAAPGGKTTHLAELMDNRGQIVACDVNHQKLNLVRQNCDRLGISIVKTCLPEQLQTISQQDNGFDAILIDTPCSNTAVLARRVEVRHRLNPIDIKNLRKIQMELLIKASTMLRPNGLLLYSTCSIDNAENELLVQDFLSENALFKLEEQSLTFPSAGHFTPSADEPAPPASQLGYHDGGFTAKLRLNS
ncbi:MAG: 16S rRNA (cytosine(967)-C(5))-methyltransferase RsmB [Sedimentisphaerales bacterium]|nr:16S rRNA (cytosine(967)-C(5))-methyltransferase RsmB [Sedimentisphaerales bacterium]